MKKQDRSQEADALLAIDIGNTNTKLGIYAGAELLHFWRLSTRPNATADDLSFHIGGLFEAAGFSPVRLAGVAVSSVVPPLMHALQTAVHQKLGHKPLIIGPGLKTGIAIKTENPAQTGADRIAAAAAALELYGPPLIVIGLGTATTFTVIDELGQYVGGAIAPGLHISANALFQAAARLPHIELDRPEELFGRDTADSMRSGIYHGFLGTLDEMTDRIRAEYDLPFQVVASGGYSRLAAGSRSIQHIHPELVLEGVRILWQKNRRL